MTGGISKGSDFKIPDFIGDKMIDAQLKAKIIDLLTTDHLDIPLSFKEGERSLPKELQETRPPRETKTTLSKSGEQVRQRTFDPGSSRSLKGLPPSVAHQKLKTGADVLVTARQVSGAAPSAKSPEQAKTKASYIQVVGDGVAAPLKVVQRERIVRAGALSAKRKDLPRPVAHPKAGQSVAAPLKGRLKKPSEAQTKHEKVLETLKEGEEPPKFPVAKKPLSFARDIQQKERKPKSEAMPLSRASREALSWNKLNSVLRSSMDSLVENVGDEAKVFQSLLPVFIREIANKWKGNPPEDMKAAVRNLGKEFVEYVYDKKKDAMQTDEEGNELGPLLNPDNKSIWEDTFTADQPENNPFRMDSKVQVMVDDIKHWSMQ